MPNTKINYIGVDLHKKTCFITIMDKMGKIKKQTEIDSDKKSVLKFFKKQTKSKVAVESTMNWIPFYESLESLIINVSLSNPLQTKAIFNIYLGQDFVKQFRNFLFRQLTSKVTPIFKD